jgi:hypothetical protein
LGYEEEERRADILAELRDGLLWLQRVLEVAEQIEAFERAQERMQFDA